MREFSSVSANKLFNSRRYYSNDTNSPFNSIIPSKFIINNKNSRSFSTDNSKGDKYKFIENILLDLNKLNHQKDFISNEETKKTIELLILDEFDNLFQNKEKFFLEDIDPKLSIKLSNYILDKEGQLLVFINKILKVYNSKYKDVFKHLFIKNILKNIPLTFLEIFVSSNSY